MKRSSLQREIFRNGTYIWHFKPDTPANPFYRIYQKKKADTLKLLQEIPDAHGILDVGGGPGRISCTLAEDFPGLQVVLMDISHDTLKSVALLEGTRRIPCLIGADAHFLPFQDGAFNCVVSLDLLCHLENPKQALLEFYRVLAPGGTLILDNTNGNPLWTLFYPKYLGRNPLNWVRIIRFRGVYPGWERIVRHYSSEKFAALLRESGFRTTKSLNYGPSLCPKWHLRVCTREGTE
jgi:ubiquinone/menaquinone biosynthesis C-methylase UbiE